MIKRSKMRFSTTMIILMSLLTPVCAMSGDNSSTVPAFSLKNQKGTIISSSAFAGKVLLVNFWSPWCIPCRQELPLLEALYGKYHAAGVEITAIGVDASEEAVAGFIEKNAISYPILIDRKRSAFEAFGCTHLPTTFIIGKDGVIKQIYKGFGNEYLQAYEQKIIELLKQP